MNPNDDFQPADPENPSYDEDGDQGLHHAPGDPQKPDQSPSDEPIRPGSYFEEMAEEDSLSASPTKEMSCEDIVFSENACAASASSGPARPGEPFKKVPEEDSLATPRPDNKKGKRKWTVGALVVVILGGGLAVLYCFDDVIEIVRGPSHDAGETALPQGGASTLNEGNGTSTAAPSVENTSGTENAPIIQGAPPQPASNGVGGTDAEVTPSEGVGMTTPPDGSPSPSENTPKEQGKLPQSVSNGAGGGDTEATPSEGAGMTTLPEENPSPPENVPKGQEESPRPDFAGAGGGVTGSNPSSAGGTTEPTPSKITPVVEPPLPAPAGTATKREVSRKQLDSLVQHHDWTGDVSQDRLDEVNKLTKTIRAGGNLTGSQYGRLREWASSVRSKTTQTEVKRLIRLIDTLTDDSIPEPIDFDRTIKDRVSPDPNEQGSIDFSSPVKPMVTGTQHNPSMLGVFPWLFSSLLVLSMDSTNDSSTNSNPDTPPKRMDPEQSEHLPVSKDNIKDDLAIWRDCSEDFRDDANQNVNLRARSAFTLAKLCFRYGDPRGRKEYCERGLVLVRSGLNAPGVTPDEREQLQDTKSVLQGFRNVMLIREADTKMQDLDKAFQKYASQVNASILAHLSQLEVRLQEARKQTSDDERLSELDEQDSALARLKKQATEDSWENEATRELAELDSMVQKIELQIQFAEIAINPTQIDIAVARALLQQFQERLQALRDGAPSQDLLQDIQQHTDQIGDLAKQAESDEWTDRNSDELARVSTRLLDLEIRAGTSMQGIDTKIKNLDIEFQKHASQGKASILAHLSQLEVRLQEARKQTSDDERLSELDEQDSALARLKKQATEDSWENEATRELAELDSMVQKIELQIQFAEIAINPTQIDIAVARALLQQFQERLQALRDGAPSQDLLQDIQQHTDQIGELAKQAESGEWTDNNSDELVRVSTRLLDLEIRSIMGPVAPATFAEATPESVRRFLAIYKLPDPKELMAPGETAETFSRTRDAKIFEQVKDDIASLEKRIEEGGFGGGKTSTQSGIVHTMLQNIVYNILRLDVRAEMVQKMKSEPTVEPTGLTHGGVSRHEMQESLTAMCNCLASISSEQKRETDAKLANVGRTLSRLDEGLDRLKLETDRDQNRNVVARSDLRQEVLGKSSEETTQRVLNRLASFGYAAQKKPEEEGGDVIDSDLRQVEHDPLLAERLYSRGSTNFFSGQVQEALPLFIAAVEHDRENPIYRYFLGLTLRRLARPQEAIAQVRTGRQCENPRYKRTIGTSLQRVQGKERAWLENLRLTI